MMDTSNRTSEVPEYIGGLVQEQGQIPSTMRALLLDGVGWGNVHISRVPTPRPGSRQLLARVDAAGICTSLIKLIEQGPAHRFVYNWDIARFPLILGDEGSVTLVEVGQELQDRYTPGQRFVIQPAVDHPPINHRERYREGAKGIGKVAVGYTLPGHLAEYIIIGEEILEAGCLLPLPNATMSYAHAALAEPFSCVVSAQDHHIHLMQDAPSAPRDLIKGIKPGGVTVIIGAGAMGRMHVDLALSYRPRVIVSTDLIEERLTLVRHFFSARAQSLGIDLLAVNPSTSDLRALVNDLTDSRGADDLIIAVASRRAIEIAQHFVGRGAVLNLFGGLKSGEDVVGIDTGLIHYLEINITGSSGGSPWDVAHTLTLMAAGDIDSGKHISRVGDLNHAIELLELVKAQQIDGKAVIYPHRRNSKILSVPSWSAEDEREYLLAGGQARGIDW